MSAPPGSYQRVFDDGWRYVCPVCILLSKELGICTGVGFTEVPHRPARRRLWVIGEVIDGPLPPRLAVSPSLFDNTKIPQYIPGAGGFF